MQQTSFGFPGIEKPVSIGGLGEALGQTIGGSADADSGDEQMGDVNVGIQVGFRLHLFFNFLSFAAGGPEPHQTPR